jgi:hypothetical protein
MDNCDVLENNPNYDCEDDVDVVMDGPPLSRSRSDGSSSVLGLSSPSLKYNAFDFVQVDVGVKTSAIRGLLLHGHFSSVALRSLATVHDGISVSFDNKKRKSVAELKADFIAHQCSRYCLLSKVLASAASVQAPLMSETEFLVCARHLRLRLGLT